MERVTGIEPASSAWEAEALPLDDTRAFLTANRILQTQGNESDHKWSCCSL
jgi:hypothetical protein